MTGAEWAGWAAPWPEMLPVPAERPGVNMEFGEAGLQDYPKERFGLAAACTAEKARKITARKR